MSALFEIPSASFECITLLKKKKKPNCFSFRKILLIILGVLSIRIFAVSGLSIYGGFYCLILCFFQ